MKQITKNIIKEVLSENFMQHSNLRSLRWKIYSFIDKSEENFKKILADVNLPPVGNLYSDEFLLSFEEAIEKLSVEELRALVSKFSITETTTTGSVAGYNTPYSFSKNRNGNVKAATTLGMTLAKNDGRWKAKNNKDTNNINEILDESRSRYMNFKESDSYKKPSAKVSYVIGQIKKMMKEVNYLTQISSRLKNEAGITPNNYWKRSIMDIQEIENQLKELKKNFIHLKR